MAKSECWLTCEEYQEFLEGARVNPWAKLPCWGCKKENRLEGKDEADLPDKG